nr:hypothetical protein Iba_scaffold25625CG0020 [Ipomoea batatas]
MERKRNRPELGFIVVSVRLTQPRRRRLELEERCRRRCLKEKTKQRRRRKSQLRHCRISPSQCQRRRHVQRPTVNAATTHLRHLELRHQTETGKLIRQFSGRT